MYVTDQTTLLPDELIIRKIYRFREQKVMLDSDLALLYGVETKVLNQAVKRNLNRFPADFMFQLEEEEFDNLKSQFVTSSWGYMSSQIVMTYFGCFQFEILNFQTPHLLTET